MYWYGDLYVGTTAAKNKSRIINKLKKHRFIKDVFVITRASNGCDLFDIYPANVLAQKYFRERDLFMIGIAVGYGEAIELVQSIIEDVYCRQGIANLKEYFDNAWAKEV